MLKLNKLVLSGLTAVIFCANTVGVYAENRNGWVFENDNWQYYNNSESPVRNQWYLTNGYWHYSDEYGNMVTGFRTIDGVQYYFDNNGVMATGWVYLDEWYYFYASGAMKTNAWQGDYYLGTDGRMVRNQWIGDYYVGGDGRWIPGTQVWQWRKAGNSWQYVNTKTNEPIKSQWYVTNGYWHYSDEYGNMVTGIQTIDGQKYLFDGNGAMTRGGWQYLDEWYYMHASGAMKTNAWQGDYYLGEDGKMARNQWIDNYYVDGDGKWVPGAQAWQWRRVGNSWQYVDTRNGQMIKSQWKKVGQYWYYFDEAGLIYIGWHLIDNDWYYFDNNGVMCANYWAGNYYLLGDGRMAKDQWVGIYHVGSDGAWDRTASITYYSQRDPRWANATYNGYNLVSTGCVPTSIAMVVDGFLHNGVTPNIMADYLVTTGEFSGRKHGGSALAIKYGAEHWGLHTTPIDSLGTLANSLSEGKAVVFIVGAGTFTSRGFTHAITLFGNSDGSTYVYDPWNAHNGWYSIEMIWNQRSGDSYDWTGGYIGYAID